MTELHIIGGLNDQSVKHLKYMPEFSEQYPEQPYKHQFFMGKRIKWLILPLHESETDRHLIGLSG